MKPESYPHDPRPVTGDFRIGDGGRKQPEQESIRFFRSFTARPPERPLS